MLIELTDSDGRGFLVNPDHVAVVLEETKTVHASIVMQGADIKVNVRESFQEIKKRFGLSITPRAETLAVTR